LLVSALQLHGFRNLAPLVLTPGAGFNVISGDNGQGKTNLLEAIYFVGTLRSFRTTHVAELIAHGAESAQLKARVARAGIERVYELRLAPRRKETRLDGKTPRSLAEYFGDFNVVLFAPEDLSVPRGSPAGRRRFLDRSVFNREPGFLGHAQRYARALKSRNAVLKDAGPDALLDVYDAELARAGARILRSRWRYLAELAPMQTQAFESITHSGLAATLEYDAGDELAGAEAQGDEALAEALHAALVGSRRRDRARRATSLGPHSHDVRFLLDGRPAKAFASQGQLRALVLAWKTAEMQLLTERMGEPPVLLLDDVSSELDATRNQFLFEFLTRLGGQCFVTTTHSRHVLVTENRVDFQVVAGEIRPL
jgi:DNA replication and repair protein RecF